MSEVGSVPWSVTGQEFVHSNRPYARGGEPIPVQPSGPVRGVVGLYIESGWFGETELNGLSLALVAEWPGPPAQDGGRAQPIVDETASGDQRAALLAVMRELAANPASTFLQVFPARFDTVLEPEFAFVGLAVDVKGRRALLKVPGFIDARGEPILDRETGEPMRAMHDSRGAAGEIELGRGWASVAGPITFETRDTHAQFAQLNMTGGGAGAA